MGQAREPAGGDRTVIDLTTDHPTIEIIAELDTLGGPIAVLIPLDDPVLVEHLSRYFE